MAFEEDLAALVRQMNPAKHAAEIALLKTAKSLADLQRIAATNGGWISPHTTDPRLKLVRHGAGTWLVVQYVDGWSSRVGMQNITP